ncbi:MAG: hypothetical protein QF535_17585 [Anaerolineales bacterium]|nr:hypothetical protein [Anaerolineales bacterium]
MKYTKGQLVFWTTHTSGRIPVGIILEVNEKKKSYTIMWTSKEQSGIITVGDTMLENSYHFYVLSNDKEQK